MHDLDRTMFELGEMAGEYGGELEGAAFEGPFETSAELGEMHEAHELELANELLEVASEQELEHFLGNLVSAATGAASRFIGSPTGRQLVGVLRDAARQALPIVGRAAGEWVRPGGGAVGAGLATSAGQLFGLELEGLSHEDRELEVARAFVRFASDAARAAMAGAGTLPPPQVVPAAVAAAARRHAPGFLGVARGRPGRRASGRWARRGNTIVIYGI